MKEQQEGTIKHFPRLRSSEVFILNNKYFHRTNQIIFVSHETGKKQTDVHIHTLPNSKSPKTGSWLLRRNRMARMHKRTEWHIHLH